MSANVSLGAWRIEHISGERRIKAVFVMTYIDDTEISQACDRVRGRQDSAIGSTHSCQIDSPENGRNPSQ
jgi:hypothetical protein